MKIDPNDVTQSAGLGTESDGNFGYFPMYCSTNGWALVNVCVAPEDGGEIRRKLGK